MPESEQDANGPDRVLRLALAMRGGVSLAVWIGGAVAEIDVLRRTALTAASASGLPTEGEDNEDDDGDGWRLAGGGPPDVLSRARIYADLLRVAGYTGVDVDILAGASAGGLNAVLYGVAQSAGTTMESVGALWSEVGHLGNLLRPPSIWAGLRAPSLLSGDGYMYAQIADRLRRSVQEGRGSPADGRPATSGDPVISDDPSISDDTVRLPPVEHLTVTLSATLLTRTGRAARREMLEPGTAEGRAYFHFVRRPTAGDSRISDLPAPSAGSPLWNEFLVSRLALAGRATSSFPAAFEPATIPSNAPQAREATWWDGEAYRTEPTPSASRDRLETPMPTMVDVFSTVRPNGGGDPFPVIDGGVFDNIPISRALRAIQLAPASGPTERRLLYLDPDPPKPAARRIGDEVSGRGSAYSALGAGLRARAMQAGKESVREDLDAIRAHNERMRARECVADVFTRELRQVLTRWDPDDGDLLTALTGTGRAAEGYGGFRATADLPRLTELLLRPQQAVVTQALFAGPFPFVEERSTLGLHAMLTAAYQRRSEPLASDLTAVAVTADFLVAWVRALQGWWMSTPATARAVPDAGWAAAARVKRRLYRVLFLATAFRDLSEHAFADRIGGRLDAAETVEEAVDAVLAAQAGQRLPSALREDLGPDGRGGPAFYDDAARALVAAARATPPAADDGDAAPLLPALWAALRAGYDELRSLSADVDPAHTGCADAGCRSWRESPFHLLFSFPGLLAGQPLDVLGRLYAGAGGLPGNTSIVEFDVLGADEPSPVADRLTGLRARVVAQRARGVLGGELPDPDRSWLDSGSKLAGNQVANFGGFLSARWRANDWTWGRADAAARLTRLLLASEGHAASEVLERPEAWDAMRRLCRVAGVPAPDGPPGTVDLSRSLVEAVREGIVEVLQSSVVVTAMDAVTSAPDVPPGGVGAPPLRVVGARPVIPVGTDPTDLRAADLSRFTTGADTLSALEPAYRGSMAMRVGLVAYRTLWPSRWSPASAVARLALVALRPLWVTALLFGAPARGAAVVALALLGWAVADTGGAGLGGPGALLLAVVALTTSGHLVGRAERARRNVAAVGDILRNRASGPEAAEVETALRDRPTPPRLPPAWRVAVAAHWRARAVVPRLWLVGGVAAAVLLGGLAVGGTVGREAVVDFLDRLPVPSLVALLVVVGGVPLGASVAARRVPAPATMQSRRRGRRYAVVAVVAVLLTVVAPALRRLDGWPPDGWVAGVLGVVLAGLLAAASVVDWLDRKSGTVAVAATLGTSIAVLAVLGGGGEGPLGLGTAIAGGLVVYALVFAALVTVLLPVVGRPRAGTSTAPGGGAARPAAEAAQVRVDGERPTASPAGRPSGYRRAESSSRSTSR